MIDQIFFDEKFNVVSYQQNDETVRVKKALPTYEAKLIYKGDTVLQIVISNECKSKTIVGSAICNASQKGTKHLLNQLYKFDGDFERISAKLFVASWLNAFS